MADGAGDLKAVQKNVEHQKQEAAKQDQAEREAQPQAGGDLYADQIYDVMRNKVPGSGPSHDAKRSADQVHAAMERAIRSVNKAKTVLESSMHGTAAGAAMGSMTPMLAKLNAKQSTVKAWGNSVNSQAHAYDARAPQLKPVSKDGPSGWDRFCGSMPWADDSIDNDKGMWQQACKENVQVFNGYHGDSTDNSSGLNGDQSPPSNTSRNKEIYNPSRAPGHGGSSAPPQAGPGGSGGTGYSGGPGTSGGPGGWQSPHSPVAGIPGGSGGPDSGGQAGPGYPGGNGGNPYTPVNPGNTSTAGYEGGLGANGHGAGGYGNSGPGAGHGGAGAGAAGGMPMGGMPMGGMGGGMGGGDIERSGRGFGGGMGSGGRAAGSGMGGARSGAGALAGEGGLGGGRGGAGAAGAAGGRGGGAPMGGGRGAKGGEDAEHQTATYLVNEDNGSEIVGDLPLTAPPVIGE
jgi:hypothetical protein